MSAPPVGRTTPGLATPDPVPTRRRLALLGLRVAVTALVFAAIVTLVPLAELRAGLSGVSLPAWLGALGGLAVGHLLAAVRWGWLLRAGGVSCGLLETMRAHGAGLFANLCLPSIVGGDVVRAGMLVDERRRAAPVAVAGLADRVVDTVALVLLAGTAAFLSRAELPSGAVAFLVVLAAGAVIIPLAGLVALRLLARSNALPSRLARGVAALSTAVDMLIARPRLGLACLGASLLVQAGFVGLNTALGRAIGIQAPFAGWLFAWPLAKLVALLPISLGGLGVRESALAGLLAPFGVAPALAVAQGLLWQSVLIALGLAAGAAAYGSRRIARSRARTVAGEPS